MKNHLRNFVNLLARAHEDNTYAMHFARRHDFEYSTMPVTAFVYEFFLYNSLYSVDWMRSIAAGQVINHTRGTEKTKQEKFESFLAGLAERNPQALRTFLPITQMTLEGDWTAVNPDPNISLQDGEEFFKTLKALQQTLLALDSFNRTKVRYAFKTIAGCRAFVYKVRNNIFHGTKHLGEIWDGDQRKRIEVYHQFLNCLVSSFFMLTENGGIFGPDN